MKRRLFALYARRCKLKNFDLLFKSLCYRKLVIERAAKCDWCRVERVRLLEQNNVGGLSKREAAPECRYPGRHNLPWKSSTITS
jgi:hypothetical protein